MRTISLELGGTTGRIAKIDRMDDDQVIRIRVELITPTQHPRYGEVLTARADRERDIWSMAHRLQEHLDGQRGANSEIDDYFRELQRFAD